MLFFHVMRYKAKDPRNPCNDRFVLSKVGMNFYNRSVFYLFSVLQDESYLYHCVQGHAAPILYAAWAEAGFVKESDLVNLRKIDCDLEGHPTPVS